MTIKKSFLEKKWYYRLGKSLLLLVPLVVIIVLFFKGNVHIQDILSKSFISIVQKNKTYLIYMVGGIIVYYLVLQLIWRLVIYLIYGGLENDTRKVRTVMTGNTGQQDTNKDNGIGGLILFILIICIITYGANRSTGTSSSRSSSVSNRGNTIHAYCNPGNTYNYASRKCCPNNAPHYFPGGYGYAAGCYPSCPYGNECGTLATRY